MLYRASIFAAILAVGAKAVDEDTSYIKETQAESCALQVKEDKDSATLEERLLSALEARLLSALEERRLTALEKRVTESTLEERLTALEERVTELSPVGSSGCSCSGRLDDILDFLYCQNPLCNPSR